MWNEYDTRSQAKPALSSEFKLRLKTLIGIERHTQRATKSPSLPRNALEIFVIFCTSCSRNLCNVIKKKLKWTG